MPNVRCRHYDDSGNALHGGCLKRGRGCYYIHPSESGWANAAPAGTQGVGKASSTSGMRPRTGFGTGANMTAVGSSSTSGWGAQPPGTPTSSAWDTSEWGLGGSGAANKGGGGWGNADNAAPAKSSTASSGDGGWGASSATKGSVVSEPWGAASSSTWGKGGGGDGGGAGTGTGGGGWGNASGGASPVRKNSTTAPPDTWGTSGASSSTTARPNLPTRPRGDRTTARGRASSGTWGADGDANTPVGWGSSGVPDLRKKDDAQPRGDTSAGSRSDMDMADWTEVSQRNSRVLRSGATSPTGTEHTTSTSFAKAGRPPTATPKDGPIALPQKAIALVAKGARLDAEIREAEAERDRIKRIQLSSSYSRVGKAGRDRMDRDRLKADEKVNERKAEQTGLIKHLATYMDPTAPTPVDPETYAKQVEEAMRYLDEAKEHIQDLRKSHLVPLQIERSAAGVTEQSTEEGEQVMEEIDDDGPRAILAARIRELTERMEHLRTDFSVTGYINLRDVIEEKIQQRFNAISAPKEEGELTRPNTPPSLPPPPPPHAELSQRVEKIGEEVSELANKTATVLTAAHQREEEFQGLKSFWEVMKQAQELAMNQQLQNETLLRQRGEEIEKLKQQVLPLMEVLSAPPPPTADLEALRASVVARIAASINQEIAPILAETRESCREQLARHKQEVYDDILKKLASPVNAQKMFRVLLAMDVDAS